MKFNSFKNKITYQLFTHKLCVCVYIYIYIYIYLKGCDMTLNQITILSLFMALKKNHFASYIYIYIYSNSTLKYTILLPCSIDLLL